MKLMGEVVYHGQGRVVISSCWLVGEDEESDPGVVIQEGLPDDVQEALLELACIPSLSWAKPFIEHEICLHLGGSLEELEEAHSRVERLEKAAKDPSWVGLKSN